jgi:excisionase family DNA binding protein
MSDTDIDPLPSYDNPLLTPDQLARKLNITRRCLSTWATKKIIPMLKVGSTCRFDLQKVKAALAKYEQAEGGH